MLRLGAALLTESLREAQKEFQKLTAHIEKRSSPVAGRGEGFYWIQTQTQTQTQGNHPECDFVQVLQVSQHAHTHAYSIMHIHVYVCVFVFEYICCVSLVVYVKVDAEVLDSAEEWDQCVRKVCPANDSSQWNTLPGTMPTPCKLAEIETHKFKHTIHTHVHT